VQQKEQSRIPEPMTFIKNVGGKNTDESSEEKAQNSRCPEQKSPCRFFHSDGVALKYRSGKQWL